jgi:putative PIN family toxin of toxin-antitoxin system
MNIPLWVLDTNVLVSGLLSPHGPPGRLIDAIFNGHLRLALDDRIEQEYLEVLSRLKFRIAAAERTAILAEIRLHEYPATSPFPRCAKLPDPDDRMFLEVAAATAEKVLVTGNVRHFPARALGPVTVLSPSAAWERLALRWREC